MKYIILLCDGMSDLPMEELGGKTPMQVAKKPFMEKLVKNSVVGLVKTVANGRKPGSDVANLSVLGYDPDIYYTGRSPLEAGSIGIDMKATDISFRCNLVTVSDEENYEDKTLVDYCSDDISTEEAKILIEFLAKNFDDDEFKLHSGVSYRHCLIWNGGTLDVGELTPPHDITGQKVSGHLPLHKNAAKLFDITKRSYDLLKNHPINIERIKRGLRPANSIWLWGEGKRANLTPFKEKFGLSASMISAVDLLKGIGKFSEMNVVSVEGATGYIDTNFEGKCDSALKELTNGQDFVYIHVEAPDECGHRHEIANKVKSIELIDKLILGRILEGLKEIGDYKLMILPDHPTPLALKTHTNDPVPFLIFDSSKPHQGVKHFSEEMAEQTGLFIEKGYELMNYFLKV